MYPLDYYLDSSLNYQSGTSKTEPLPRAIFSNPAIAVSEPIPFDILSNHAIDEREQETVAVKGETERRWRRKTKRCERFTSMRTTIGERRPYDIYDVRSRDCHATDTHVS